MAEPPGAEPPGAEPSGFAPSGFAPSGFAPSGLGPPGAVLRVLSWNLRDLLDDPAAAARLVRELAPDLACLQEVPRRPGSRWRLRALADRCGMAVLAGGRASAGTAILGRPGLAVPAVAAFRLPVAGRLTRRRGAVVARVATPAGEVAVASVHLSLDAGERLRHVAELCARLVRTGLPAVVAGDFNEPPQGPVWSHWAPTVHDPAPGAGPTFPSAGPSVRLDAVLVGAGIGVREYLTGPGPAALLRRASDHLPVLAVLELPGTAPAVTPSG